MSELDYTRIFQPIFGASVISDDLYSSIIKENVVYLWAHGSTRFNCEHTWEIHGINAEIMNKLSEGSRIIWLLIWQTSSISLNSPNVYKQSINLKDERVIYIIV